MHIAQPARGYLSLTMLRNRHPPLQLLELIKDDIELGASRPADLCFAGRDHEEPLPVRCQVPVPRSKVRGVVSPVEQQVFCTESQHGQVTVCGLHRRPRNGSRRHRPCESSVQGTGRTPETPSTFDSPCHTLAGLKAPATRSRPLLTVDDRDSRANATCGRLGCCRAQDPLSAA